MIFNSLTFVVFFAIVLALHSLPFSWTVKKTNLLIASYIFYAAWSPPFVLLLWITTLVDFFVAKLIYRTEQKSKRRLLLLVSLAGLGILGYFKYGAFLLTFTWVFFRANDFHGAFHMTLAMIGVRSAGQPFPYFNVDTGEVRAVLVVITALLVTSWMLRDSSLEQVASRIPWWATSIVLTVMMLSIVLVQGESRAFIYFQF